MQKRLNLSRGQTQSSSGSSSLDARLMPETSDYSEISTNSNMRMGLKHDKKGYSRSSLMAKQRCRQDVLRLLILVVGIALLSISAFPSPAYAFKLPSFLSWIQPNSATSQSIASVSSNDGKDGIVLSGESMKLQQNRNLFLNQIQQTTDEMQMSASSPSQESVQAKPASSPRKHFHSMLSLPGRQGQMHLFSALPKSLFGRFLSQTTLAPNMQTHLNPFVGLEQQQQQQNSPIYPLANRPVFPVTATFVPHNRRPLEHHIVDQFKFKQRPLVMEQQYKHQLPFRETNNELQMTMRQQEPKKHALGFGENEDFMMMMHHHHHHPLRQPIKQQQQVSIAEQEEYRDIPAVLIEQESTNQQAENSSFPLDNHLSGLNQTEVVAGKAEESASLVSSVGETKLIDSSMGQNLKNDTTEVTLPTITIEQQNNSTNLESANVTSNVLTGLINDELTKLKQEPEILNKTIASMSKPMVDLLIDSVRQQEQNQQQHVVEAPKQLEQSEKFENSESGRSESSAASIVVAPNEELTSGDLASGQTTEELESFVLGPYKGLTSDRMPTMQPMASELRHMNQFRSQPAMQQYQIGTVGSGRLEQQQQVSNHQQNLNSVGQNVAHMKGHRVPFDSEFDWRSAGQQFDTYRPISVLHQQQQQQKQQSFFWPPNEPTRLTNTIDLSQQASFVPPRFSNQRQQQQVEGSISSSSTSSGRYFHTKPFVGNIYADGAERIEQQIKSDVPYFIEQQQQLSPHSFNREPPLRQPSLRLNPVLQQQDNRFRQNPQAYKLSSSAVKSGKSHPLNSVGQLQQQQQQVGGYQQLTSNNQVASNPQANQHLRQQEMQGELSSSAKFKSGLYQIDAPRLTSTEEKQQQQQQVVADSEADADEQLQQQHLSEQQSNALEGNEEDENEDDNDNGEQQQVTEVVSNQQQQPLKGEMFATKQVGASIGVGANKTQAHKGQVFNDSVVPKLQLSTTIVDRPRDVEDSRNISQTRALKHVQEVSVYDTEIPVRESQQMLQQEPQEAQTTVANQVQRENTPIRYLETQVYTIPYNLDVQSDSQTRLVGRPVAANYQYNTLPEQRQPLQQQPFYHGGNQQMRQVTRNPYQYQQSQLVPQVQPPIYRTFQQHQNRYEMSQTPHWSANQFSSTNYQPISNKPRLNQQLEEFVFANPPFVAANPANQAQRHHYFQYQPIQQPLQHQQQSLSQFQKQQYPLESPSFTTLEKLPEVQFNQQSQFAIAIQHSNEPNQQASTFFSNQQGPANLANQQGSANFANLEEAPKVTTREQSPIVEQVVPIATTGSSETLQDTQQFRTIQVSAEENPTTISPNSNQDATTTSSRSIEMPEGSREGEKAQREQEAAARDEQLQQLSQDRDRGPQERQSQGISLQQPSSSPSSFCSGKAPGLYADELQRCKAYYQCAPTGHQMFRCNNQTQFNQKTQNCDWWYNVDCGGRLGSPSDFEQARSSTSSESPLQLPNPSASSSSDDQANGGLWTVSSLLVPSRGNQEVSDLLDQQQVSNTSTSNPEVTDLLQQQPQQDQQQQEPTSSTASYTKEESTRVNEFSERSSTTQDPLLRISTESQLGNQNDYSSQPQVGDEQVGVSSAAPISATTKSSQSETINNSYQTQTQTPTSTSTTTTTISQATNGEQAPSTSEPDAQQPASSSLQLAQSRRLVQSEFGLGVQQSSDSSNNKLSRFEITRHSRRQSGNLLSGSLQSVTEGNQLEQHSNHRYGSNGNQLEPVYSTSANQGSVIYTPTQTGSEALSTDRKAVDSQEQRALVAGTQSTPVERRFGARLLSGSSGFRNGNEGKVAADKRSSG